MDHSVIEAIDKEIALLQSARELLSGTSEVTSSQPKRGRGRPKGSANAKSVAPAKVVKRTVSIEARARIAEAQRKRWAAVRKAA
jgi:hypothetical protein